MSETFRIDQASPTEREYLGSIRASSWRGFLTVEQFVERNRWLYRHPYGQKKIQTLALRDHKGQILSSLDALEVPLWVKREKVQKESGYLIASVFTPEAFRDRGYAARLLQHWFTSAGNRAGVLYSDIGETYYRKFGFLEVRRWSVSVPVGSASHQDFEPEPLESALAFCQDFRKRQLEKGPSNAVALCPDEEWMDWILERYRFFSQLVGKALPKEVFWRWENERAWVVPSFPSQTSHLLWITGKPGFETGKAVSRLWDLSALAYWSASPTENGHPELPMASIGSGNPATFTDPQWVDWW